MLRMITMAGVVLFASTLAFAETFTGVLVDTSCTCAPTTSTSSFAIQVSGKMLKLDAAGNKKAEEAMKNNTNSANRSATPNANENQVMAKVEGQLSGDEIKVSSIQIQ